ncbi:MAG TPA: thymidylate synthase [Symbiobacteriaceae bacterium]|jgi:thymidylate synthase|nr:thymidylate synthase [Symbiobacteriaceae bacterium]
MNIERQYLQLCQEILNENEAELAAGQYTQDRTGTGTVGVFGRMLKHDLRDGFPALTTKQLYFKLVKVELLWFLAGRTDLEYLHQYGCHIWDKDAARRGGVLGPIYGKQWRAWEGADGRTYDQIQWVVDEIRQIAAEPDKPRPSARRLIVNPWNVAQLDDMALPPCHGPFQFQVSRGKLNLAMWQRSADLFLGVPFNIASYALLMHMVAQVTGLEVGTYTHYLNDVHIYRNLVDQVRVQVTREPLPLPRLWLNPDVKDIFAFTVDDIKLVGYKHHAPLHGEMSS